MDRLLAVLHTFSRIALVFGLTLLLPIGVSLWIGDGAYVAFDEALLGTLAVTCSMINVTGGYLITFRMIKMFKRKGAAK